MTEQEAQALTGLLQRTPMTQAEALWVTALLSRLRQRPEAEQRTSAEDERERETP